MSSSLESTSPTRSESNLEQAYESPPSSFGNLVDLLKDAGQSAEEPEDTNTSVKADDDSKNGEAVESNKVSDQAGAKASSLPIFGLDFNVDFGALKKEKVEKKEELQKDPESAKERESRFRERFKTVTGQDSVIEEGPEAELHMWADSWRDFVEVAEVPEGPFRDLLQEFGSQMLLGELDGKEIAGLIGKVEFSEELQEVIEGINDYDLKSNMARLEAKFGENGRLQSIELQSLNKEREADAEFGFDSSGKLHTEAEGPDIEGKRPSQEEVIKRVAMKVSPLACP